jgi:hypothetical protein
MNREDIIRMAREADREWDCDRDMVEWLEWFAALVAAAEREACAKECDELAGMLFCHGDKSGAEIAVSLRDTIRARGKTT